MAKQADAFPTTSTPTELPEAERLAIEAEIERHLSAADTLIAALDRAQGDVDFEDGGDDLEDGADDEPSLGWTGDIDQDRALKGCAHSPSGPEPIIVDAEYEHDGSEPSLGSLGSGYNAESFDQERWAVGNCTDLEEEHDGREPGGDDEPSLGWTTSGVGGRAEDLEEDASSEGPHDLPTLKPRRRRRKCAIDLLREARCETLDGLERVTGISDRTR